MQVTATSTRGQRLKYWRAAPVRTTADAAEVARAGALVVDAVAYVATVEIWLHNALNKHQLAELVERCVRVDPMKRACWQAVGDMPGNSYWRAKLVLQQPRDVAFELLDELLVGDWFVSRVDFALDLITNSTEDAATLSGFFARTLMKCWHGRQRLGRSGRTLYTAFKGRAPNKIALYDDLPSKANWLPRGTPCFHFEWRCFGCDATERAGVTDGWSLVDFDHHEFWERRLRLAAVDFGRLGQLAWQRGSGRRRPTDKEVRIGNDIAYLAAHDNQGRWPLLSTQQVKDFCIRSRHDLVRHIDNQAFNRCLVGIDIKPFLPRI